MMRLQVLEGTLRRRKLAGAGVVCAAAFAAPSARAQDGNPHFVPPQLADVPRGHWASEAVSRLIMAGAIEGTPAGRFDGARAMTRFEMIVALPRLFPVCILPVFAPAVGQPKEDEKAAVRLVAVDGEGREVQVIPEFSDVPRGHWAYEALVTVARSGLAEGRADGSYGGERPATRYECAVVLARMLAASANSSARSQEPKAKGEPFPDVLPGHWAHDAVKKMAYIGVFEGASDGHFHGTRTLSRYEFAVALSRLLDRAS